MEVLSRVRHFIAEHRLAGPDSRVVLAVSGGSDSVALAHIARELAASGEIQIAGLAHFNHQLRDAADEDERFCARLAGGFGWSMLAEREDVRARARNERRSLEDAARTARHAFFARARAHFGADVVALGHTRDDQAETYLLRLLRGAGPRGLASMYPRHRSIVRPLLRCRRAELREYLAARDIPFRDDESNQDVGIPRNRVRRELLPFIEQRFNPGIVDVLADQADIARDDWEWMSGAAEFPTSPLSLEISELMAAPLALRRVVLWRAMTEAAGNRPVSFEHVQAALGLLGAPDGCSIDVPGHRVERVADTLVLTRREAGVRSRLASRPANNFEYPLSIPGEVAVPLAGCVVTADIHEQPELLLSSWSAGRPAADPRVAVVRRDVCVGGLRVRNRRPGDRFTPVGVGGRKKLQDFFVDKKVTRERRDAVPLVVDETDRIVWVAGFGIDDEFRVTEAAQAVLILRLKDPGGPA